MTRQEPPWLTALYSVVGLIIIALAVGFLALLAKFWYIFLIAGGLLAGWSVYRRSLQQQQARDDLDALYQQARYLREHSQLPDATGFADRIITDLGRDGDRHPSAGMLGTMLRIPDELYEAEKLDTIPSPPPIPDSIIAARYRDQLVGLISKLSDPALMDVAAGAVVDSFKNFAETLPPAALHSSEELIAQVEDRAPAAQFTVPLIDMLPDAGRSVEELILPYYGEKVRSLGLFANLRERFDRNLHAVSKVPYRPGNKDSPQLIMPTDHEGNASEIVCGYLAGTPFEVLFGAQIPFAIPEQLSASSTPISSPAPATARRRRCNTSSCPTSPRPNRRASSSSTAKATCCAKSRTWPLFDPDHGALADRLIDHQPDRYRSSARPQHVRCQFRAHGLATTPPPANKSSTASSNSTTTSSARLLGAELTQKQSVIFRYLARLMLTIPGATIHTLIELMGDITPFMDNIRGAAAGRPSVLRDRISA